VVPKKKKNKAKGKAKAKVNTLKTQQKELGWEEDERRHVVLKNMFTLDDPMV